MRLVVALLVLGAGFVTAYLVGGGYLSHVRIGSLRLGAPTPWNVVLSVVIMVVSATLAMTTARVRIRIEKRATRDREDR